MVRPPTPGACPLQKVEGVTELTKLAELEPRAFIEEAEALGELDEEIVEAYAHEHELDEEELSHLRAELEERGVELISAPHAEPVARVTAPVSGATDSLTLFINEAGRYPLLTAAEEVALAKRVERGDAAAKERMINSNLRLVVSIAKRYQGHGLQLGDLI